MYSSYPGFIQLFTEFSALSMYTPWEHSHRGGKTLLCYIAVHTGHCSMLMDIMWMCACSLYVCMGLCHKMPLLIHSIWKNGCRKIEYLYPSSPPFNTRFCFPSHFFLWIFIISLLFHSCFQFWFAMHASPGISTRLDESNKCIYGVDHKRGMKQGVRAVYDCMHMCVCVCVCRVLSKYRPKQRRIKKQCSKPVCEIFIRNEFHM